MFAKLAEISILLRINPETTELEDLIKDTLDIYNNPFDQELIEDPLGAYDVIKVRAESCPKQTDIGESLRGAFSSNSQKETYRREQLAWFDDRITDLSVNAASVMNTDSSKAILKGFVSKKKVLIIPSRGEQRDRLFISAKS